LEAEFRVTLELDLANRIMALAQRRPAPSAPRSLPVARWLRALAKPLGWLGSDTACLSAEVMAESGEVVRASLTGRGQRLAILPTVLAVEALLSGELRQRGCVRPASWLEPEEWVERLRIRGIRFDGPC